ncbi:MAG: P-loop NTPase [Clostridia bacterium]|nr:P-loop NTPase [Clostridia bacterium]MBR0408218.1 P-loop NTPase [Clostridia bacterium]
MGRIFSIMSGKGGVGKSTLSVSLAEFYARTGKTVVLLDGDIGQRCADLMLNVQDRVVYDLGDVADKTCKLEEALLPHPVLPTLSLLAAPQILTVSDVKRKAMDKIITQLSERSDILLLDAPAGIGKGLKNLLGTTAEPVVVVTPDDVCIRDAERLSALLSQMEEPRPSLVLNRVRPMWVRRRLIPSPEQIAQTLDMPLLGVIPESTKIYRALLRHETALDCGDKKVANAIEVIAARMLGADAPLPEYAPSAVLRFFNRGGEA